MPFYHLARGLSQLHRNRSSVQYVNPIDIDVSKRRMGNGQEKSICPKNVRLINTRYPSSFFRCEMCD